MRPIIRQLLSGSTPKPSLDWPLKTTLAANIGSNTPTFSRASIGGMTDFDNFTLKTNSGEVRFVGARRNENLVAGSSQDLTAAGWSKQSNGTGVLPTVTKNFTSIFGMPASRLQMDKGAGTTGSDYCNVYNSCAKGQTFSFCAKTNNGATSTIICKPVSGAANLVVITPNEQRFTVVDTASAGNVYFQLQGGTGCSDSVDISITDILVESNTYRNNISPSEMENSVGVLSAPFNGAGVDKIKYFGVKNPNLGITTFGDSLTGVGVPTPYPKHLQAINTEQAITNLGVGGHKTADMLTVIQTNLRRLYDTVIIWIGVNDVTNAVPTQTTKDKILSSIALIPHDRYIILGTLNWAYTSWPYLGSNYNQIIALNSWMATTFGAHYFDMRSYLVSLYDPNNADDVLCFQNDSVPASLKSDAIHLNDAGYSIVAQKVSELLAERSLNILYEQIAESTLKGILSEQERKNYFVNSRVPVTQTIDLTTPGTGDYTLRVKGAGNVTCAAGSATGTGFGVASAGTDITFNLSAAGTVTFTCAAIAAGDIVQVEKGAFASSFIETAAAAVTRVKDVLTRPTANELPVNNFVIKLEWTPQNVGLGTVFIWGTYVDANNYTALLHDGANLIFRKRIAGVNYEVTKALSYAANTTYKIACRQSVKTGMSMWIDSTRAVDLANVTDAQIGTTIQVGADGNSANQDFSCHKNLKFYHKKLTDRQAMRLVA